MEVIEGVPRGQGDGEEEGEEEGEADSVEKLLQVYRLCEVSDRGMACLKGEGRMNRGPGRGVWPKSTLCFKPYRTKWLLRALIWD